MPSAKAFASLDEQERVYWMPLDKPQLAAAARELEAYPAPVITAVMIGGLNVTNDPASYLRLFTVEATDPIVYPRGLADDWEPVTFVSRQRSPWTRA